MINLKFLSFLIFLFSHNLLFCQAFKPNIDVIKKYNIKKYEIFEYIIDDENNENIHSRRTNTYNENGLILEEKLLTLEYNSKKEYLYEDNKLKEMLFFENNSDSPSKTIQYKYDENDNLIEEIDFDIKHEMVENKLYNKFHKISLLKRNEIKFDEQVEISYLYDESGLLILEKEVSDDGIFEISYIYDNGLNIKKECKYKSLLIYTIFYHYNNKNKLISSYTRRNNIPGNQLDMRSIHLYQYDEVDQLAAEKIITNIVSIGEIDDEVGLEFDEDVQGDITEILHTYDERGLLKTTEYFENNVPTRIYKHNY